MKVYITRDSVCAGDDVDAPHARQITIPDGLPVDAVIRHIIAAADLPDIADGNATWCLSSNLALAVIAQQWPEHRPVRFLPPTLAELDFAKGVYRFHFSYLAQHDPALVLEILARLPTRTR